MIFESNTFSLAKVMDGQDGKGQYIHIMYSDIESPQVPGDMSTIPSDYMGICVNTSPTPPQDPLQYTWQKVKGDDGKQGATGRPGTPGQDGATYYVHIKWSNDGGITFSDGTGAWMGVLVDSSPDPIEIPAIYQWTRVAGTDGTVIYLSNESHTVPVDENGLNGDYSGASTTITIFEGKEDTTNLWSIDFEMSEGVTGTFINNEFTLTEIIRDSGYVDFTATRTGYASLNKRFQIATVKSGKTGEPTVTKWLMVEPSVIHKNINGEIDPKEIIMTAKQQSGENPIEEYKGKFKVIIDDKLNYESQTLESSKVISVENTAKEIQIELYSDTDQLIDYQSIIVVSDGQHGSNGKTYVLNIKSETGTIIYDYTGANPIPQTISPFTSELYENGILIESGITYEWSIKSVNSVLSGTSSSNTFTPTLSKTYDPNKQYENAIVLIAKYNGQTLYSSQPILVQKSAKPGTNAITAVLSNEAHTIPTDSNGENGNYQGAASTITIYDGTSDVTAAWNVTVDVSSGITGSLSGKTYTVTKITADSGYVDFIATRNGYSDIKKRFQISRVKYGKQGEDGNDSATYWLLCDSSVIYKSPDGSLSPTSIKLTGMSQKGINDVASYSCRFKIYTDNTLVYTSSIDETIKTYTVPSAIKNIKIEMYKSGSTTVLLDQQTIPVLSDGAPGKDGEDGVNGADGYTVLLTNENESFQCDSTGAIVSTMQTSTEAIVYKGTTEITCTIGKLPTVTGMQLSVLENVVTIVVNKGSDLAEKGSFEIPILADGKTFSRIFSWTKVTDASGDLDEIKNSITKVESTVDKINGEIENFVSYDVFNENNKNIESKFSNITQNVDSITSEVSSIKTDFQSKLDAHSTKITQTADKLELIATGDSQSGITLTENFITLVSDEIGIEAQNIRINGLVEFMNSANNGTATVIDGGSIKTNTITTKQLVANILRSENYKEPVSKDVFAQDGSFFNLVDGSFTSKNFAITNDGSVFVRGKIEATSGVFNGTVYAVDGHFKGTIEATGGSFKGTIEATGGKFTGLIESAEIKGGKIEGTLLEGTVINGAIIQSGKSITCGQYFSVDENGILKAVNANISGTITAAQGQIGGFTISNNALYSGGYGALGNCDVYLGTDGISCGSTFQVTADGHMIANTGEIAGFKFTNAYNQEDHAYENTIYGQMISGNYIYQFGIKGESQTANPDEAAFYVRRKKVSDPTWEQEYSEIPFYVTKDGRLKCDNITATSITLGGDKKTEWPSGGGTVGPHDHKGDTLGGSGSGEGITLWAKKINVSGEILGKADSSDGGKKKTLFGNTTVMANGCGYNCKDKNGAEVTGMYVSDGSNTEIGTNKLIIGDNGYTTIIRGNNIQLGNSDNTTVGVYYNKKYYSVLTAQNTSLSISGNNLILDKDGTKNTVPLPSASGDYLPAQLVNKGNPTGLAYVLNANTLILPNNKGYNLYDTSGNVVTGIYVSGSGSSYEPNKLIIGDNGYTTVIRGNDVMVTMGSNSMTSLKDYIEQYSSGGGTTNGSLTISFNGTSQGSWNGSSSKTVNITPSSIGAATSGHTHSGYASSSHTHSYSNISWSLSNSHSDNSGHMHRCIGNSSGYGLWINTSNILYGTSNVNAGTKVNDVIQLGESNYRFKTLYIVNAVNTGSDRNLKTNISTLNSNIESFYMDLNPVSYMLKNFSENDNHDRIHYGFIAQDVEKALVQHNISNEQAAFLCIDKTEEPNEAGEFVSYSLRYGEFVSLNTHMTQKAHRRIDSHDKEIEELKSTINQLQEKIAQLEDKINSQS